MAGRQPFETVAVSYEECRLVRGEKFGASIEFQVSSSGAYYIKGITDSKLIEMFARGITIETGSSQGIDCSMRLFEDCQGWNSVNPIEIFCENREVNQQSVFEMFQGVSGGTLGIEIKPRGNKIKTAQREFSFQVQESNRYRMKKATDYILLIENFDTTNSIDITLVWEWFEVRG